MAPAPEPDPPARSSVQPPAALIGGGANIRPVRLPSDFAPEPRYRPSTGLDEFVRVRDMTCRFPGCDHTAEFCDVGHAIPYPYGPTHPSNLKCLCRKQQRLRIVH
ncbi:hypothetical protein MLAC_23330 [Mycobacterium lacus]|uniref:HNH nuclease domain-containing protein n=1 Tax=Mycobacterium lacus TaxID=169765 RepID=A0A7I7NL80_9MYCO|nr:hypothetical protein MLAC_23330 [Mycobacterium lacus]